MPNSLLSVYGDDPLDNLEHNYVDVKSVNTFVLPRNPSRRCLWIINDSDRAVYVSFGQNAVAHQGFRINRDGGMLYLCLKMSNICSDEIYAIHDGSGLKRLLVTEGI